MKYTNQVSWTTGEEWGDLPIIQSSLVLLSCSLSPHGTPANHHACTNTCRQPQHVSPSCSVKIQVKYDSCTWTQQSLHALLTRCFTSSLLHTHQGTLILLGVYAWRDEWRCGIAGGRWHCRFKECLMVWVKAAVLVLLYCCWWSPSPQQLSPSQLHVYTAPPLVS